MPGPLDGIRVIDLTQMISAYAGRLASLGYSIIKKKAEENFAQFEARFRKELETS